MFWRNLALQHFRRSLNEVRAVLIFIGLFALVLGAIFGVLVAYSFVIRL